MKMSGSSAGHDWYDWVTLIVSTVSGVGTLIALLVAVFLGKRQLEQFKTEQAQRDVEQHQRDEERRQEQARCVSARVFRDGRLETKYAKTASYAGMPSTTIPTTEMVRFPSIEVLNASPWPIYDARARVREDGPFYMVDFVAGNKSMKRSLEGHGEDDAPQGPVELLEFRDAANQWWARDKEGYLRPLDGPSAEARWPREKSSTPE